MATAKFIQDPQLAEEMRIEARQNVSESFSTKILGQHRIGALVDVAQIKIDWYYSAQLDLLKWNYLPSSEYILEMQGIILSFCLFNAMKMKNTLEKHNSNVIVEHKKP